MTLRLINPSMGNDPELFIKLGNRLIPSERILAGSTARRLKVDNVAVELHPGPRFCLQEQNKDIANTLSRLKGVLNAKRLGTTHVSLRPVERISADDIKRYESVCLFGCAPSLVYNGQWLDQSRPDVDPHKVRYRSAGYHVHVGLDTPDKLIRDGYDTRYDGSWLTASRILHSTDGRVRLVQVCDLIVGLPAVLLERDPRVVIRRQVLGYGKAGEFREQPHGFEYRTLGSWPLLDPMWGWWANAAVRDALNIVVADQDSTLKQGIDLQQVSTAINTNNLAQALDLWHRVKTNLQPIVQAWSKSHQQYDLQESHPLLREDYVRYFDFLALTKCLANKRFTFTKWCRRRRSDYANHPIAFHHGFPSQARAKCQDHPQWMEFYRNWSMSRDVMSRTMLA